LNDSFTLGKQITEDELRAYTKCSKFYYFGGKTEGTFGLKVVKDTVERLTIKSIRGLIKDPMLDVHASLLTSMAHHAQKESLIEPQIERYLSACMLWLEEFFNLFAFSTYIPVFGPIKPTIKVSNTPVKLDISGIYRSTKNQTIHAVSFSPYKTKHAIINDPTLILKMKLLSPFVNEHFPSNRPKIKLHVFYYGKSHNLGYVDISSNSIDENRYKMIENIVANMEQAHNYPVIPCLYSCKYKKICLPSGENNE
jgi:hypothetical protein